MNILNLVNSILAMIKQANDPLSSIDSVLMSHLQLQRPIPVEPLQVASRITNFIQANEKMLEFKVTSQKGIYIRVYRNQIEFTDGKIKLSEPSAVAVYHRGRYPGLANPKMELIGYLSKALDSEVKRHLSSFNQLKSKSKTITGIPTLSEFLPTYTNILYLQNPETVDRKIKLISSKFKTLLSYPIDEIRGKELRAFITSFRRNRTSAQIQNGDSPYTVSESTIKDYVCTLRAALQAASEETQLFKCCESLYGKGLKFKIDNASDKHLSDEELEKIINSLKKRDEAKRSKPSNCLFTDYLTPLLITCLATGLRPKYALALRWSDIDTKNMIIKVRGTKGKIKETQWCDIPPDLLALLNEWKKHACHQGQGIWLFPSNTKPNCHIVSFKTTFTSFRKNYDLDFVLYDTRHTFATLITKLYKDIKVTQEVLHHKDRKSTDRYAWVIKSSKSEAINELSNQYSFYSEYCEQEKVVGVIEG